MGSYNRDYMQDSYEGRGSSWGYDYPTTKWLMIITVVVFFLQTILTYEERNVRIGPIAQVAASSNRSGTPDVKTVAGLPIALRSSYIEEWCLLDANKVLHGQVWRLVTYVFCHYRPLPWTLVFNMLALWYLGSTLERMYGSREILWFYLGSAVICGAIFTAIGMATPLPLPLIGSGPCVMALFALYATHFPTQEILFMWIIPIQIRVLLIIYVLIDLYSVLQVYAGAPPLATMAYLSNLWGIAFGYCYRKFDWHLTGMVDWLNPERLRKSMRRARASRKLKVFTPEPSANLDEQVDAILAKIHEQGSESLTERERAVLQQASERAKNRL
jgi:membrane associated rhomboid family serine protease